MAKDDKQKSPPGWKEIIVKWLGLFPVILVISYCTKWIGIQPLYLKLFVETVIIVPLLHYAVTPLMKTLFSDWLYAGMDVPEEDRETVEIGA